MTDKERAEQFLQAIKALRIFEWFDDVNDHLFTHEASAAFAAIREECAEKVEAIAQQYRDEKEKVLQRSPLDAGMMELRALELNEIAVSIRATGKG